MAQEDHGSEGRVRESAAVEFPLSIYLFLLHLEYPIRKWEE